MTSINPLTTLLGTTFRKFDCNKDGKLNRAEFNSFYEILKPGTAYDEEGQLKMTSGDYFKRMDANGDRSVSNKEVLDSGVLMPSELCSDGSIDALLQYLQQQVSETAALAASLLLEPAESKVEDAGKAD